MRGQAHDHERGDEAKIEHQHDGQPPGTGHSPIVRALDANAPARYLTAPRGPR
jgi:hypothetical protein